MLKGLASFIMSGLFQAVLVSIGFALVSLVLPPFGVVSGAAPALVALRIGRNRALQVVLIAAVVLSGIVLLISQSILTGIIYAVVQWLPVIPLAMLLRQQSHWGSVMQWLLLAGLALLLILHLAIEDLPVFWLSHFREIFEPAMQQTGVPQPEIDRLLPQMANLMTGLLAVSWVLTLILSLMLGRSMQASLYNPGGFASEFRELRLGQWPAIAGVVLLILVSLTHMAYFAEALMLVLLLYFFQGLAVAHGLANKLNWPPFVLVILYLLLLFVFVPMTVMVSAFGLIDSFADFRKRLSENS
jgi:hypothetical protein